MGFFGFGQRKTALNWNLLEDISVMEELLATQDDMARIFFKHSTRCSISSMALHSFEANWEGDDAQLYFIDLLRFRELSNALAEQTGVMHQSPQAIVVRNKEVIYHASHSGIDAQAIQKLLTKP